MLFEYRYFGNTAVDSTASSTGMSFAPDTGREPTYFQGQLSQRVPFRECISALHDVVVSDLRFRPRDRTEYFEWLKGQQDIDVVALGRHRTAIRKQIDSVTAELNALQAKHRTRRNPFLKAREKYFRWLYRRNYDAWFVLDPVVTVHPDEVFFECFSQDESSYGRVGCSYEVFEGMGEFACGTTNVDYSSTLYAEFQKIRDYKDTSLTVDPSGFEVQTAADASYREVKIDLPDSWVRGFLQVSAAMGLPAATVQLHPMDVHNFCFVLRRNKERRSPRSMRFILEPGQPVRVIFEPWNLPVTCPRSVYVGDESREIRVWGRRRILLLERLIPVARSFTAVLLGTGMPSFWIADCGDISFTLGLSGWTANDWSGQANFDLLAPRGEVDSVTSEVVFSSLKHTWLGTPEVLARELALDQGTTLSALTALTQAGRVMYDLNKGVYRVRELSREPLDMGRFRWSNPREEAAARAVSGGAVSHRHVRVDGQGHTHVSGRVGRDRLSLVLDPDHRMRRGECTCSYHFRNKLRKGPCEHLLALRLAHERGVGEVVDVDSRPAPTRASPTGAAPQSATPRAPQARRVIPFQRREPEPPPEPAPFTPRVVRRSAQEAQDREAERLVALLIGRGLVELDPEQLDAFAADVRLVLRYKDLRTRADYMWDLLMTSEAVEEFYLSEEDLVALLRSWG